MPFFFPPPFQTIMDKSLGTLSRFWGVLHTGPSPPVTPQTILDACIQNFSEWRTARKFRKFLAYGSVPYISQQLCHECSTGMFAVWGSIYRDFTLYCTLFFVWQALQPVGKIMLRRHRLLEKAR